MGGPPIRLLPLTYFPVVYPVLAFRRHVLRNGHAGQ